MQKDSAISESENGSGLTDSMLESLRATYGYNELLAPKESLLKIYLKNFWGPLPWLMEVLIAVSFFSGQQIEGGVIAVLLVINTLVSVFQRRSADAALTALTERLSLNARARRDGAWQSIPARELLPGDIIRVRVGDVVPADAEILEGSVSVDLSSLTGESLPKEAAQKDALFSGSVLRRGEATARVSVIGSSTAYGKTTELLETSHPPTHMERIIFGIIKYSFGFNVLLAICVTLFGLEVHAEALQIVNFVIVLLLTSVPISFPTMFAVAQSYGALEIGKSKDKGALVRRLAAVQECAMVDVFCSDKTGTLTLNELKVASTTAYGNYRAEDVLGLGAAVSNPADEDSIDKAILDAASEKSATVPRHQNFIPFDSATKRTEADVLIEGKLVRVLKGLPELLLAQGVRYHEEASADLARLSASGFRVVAVVAKRDEVGECVGLIALADPIREDAPSIIAELQGLGVRFVMITGDGRATAQAVARELGLRGRVVTAEELKKNPEEAVESAVFAEAYPEDKLTIIRALQAAGHTVGMTGDGVNDAPALRQAEAGIAVFGATDVAKQSASFILTTPGLEGVVRAVKISRGVYARIRTWALNKIIKSFEVSVFTTAIFFITHSYILSPLLAVLLIFANDFVTIAIATDVTEHVKLPAHWSIGRFALGACVLAVVPIVLLCLAYVVATRYGLSAEAMRTAIYVALIYYGKANLLSVRSWWRGVAHPSFTLLVAIAFSLTFTTVISLFGILIAPVPLGFVLITIAFAVADFFLIGWVKRFTFVRELFGIAPFAKA